MECVNCTQCIDACDEVMDRTQQPRGLIRYTSQQGLEGKPTRILRPRVLAYCGVIALVTILFVVLIAGRTPFYITLLRGLGRPYVVHDSGEVENLVRIKIVNRTDGERTYRIQGVSPDTMRIAGTSEFTIGPQGVATEPLRLMTPVDAFVQNHGLIDAQIQVTDDQQATIEHEYPLFGPSNPPAKAAEPQEPRSDG
jgi:polyferredoxin